MSLNRLLCSAASIAAALLGGCRSAQPDSSGPPPDVRRPVLRSQAELAAERERLIETGQVVPAAAPTFASQQPVPAASAPAPLVGGAASISGDILLVNNSVLTAAEVLYLLRDEITEARQTLTPRRFVERLENWVREVVQQEIGILLVYERATAGLDDSRRQALDKAVERELDGILNNQFGGSSARLTSHLERYGLTLDAFRERLRRQLVVSSYTREIIAPRVQLRRDELLRRYRENEARYTTPETRELLMIEAPFERFLPPGVDWQHASSDERTRARLAAVRHIRAAAEALKQRPFQEVAREMSRGLHAADGGSWGLIGAPLQPPFDQASRWIFEHGPGQPSEPIETAAGWCIVACGEIRPAARLSFEQVQDELRQELFRERFNRLAGEYMLKLARDAAISSLESFIRAVVRRASDPDWPEPPRSAAAPQR